MSIQTIHLNESAFSASSDERTAPKSQEFISINRPTKSSKKQAFRKFASESSIEALKLQQTLSAMGKYVGELHEKWTFASDHLPIGATIFFNGENINILSWNVLNKEYMDPWMYEMDSQGLMGSMITDLDTPIQGSTLTKREIYTADLVLKSIHGTGYEKDLICLQECSKDFINYLSSILPKEYAVICSDLKALDQNIVVYNTKSFEFQAEQSNKARCIFSEQPERGIMDLVFTRNGKELRLVNVHLPGDPNGPARFEFARFLCEANLENDAVIGLGDMNFNEVEMAEAMQLARAPEHTQLSPYPTNISPKGVHPELSSKAIDHFICLGVEAKSIAPEHVIEGTSQIVDVLS